MDQYNFQCCQKLVVFRNNDSELLLAQRSNEADYNLTFSFIGGKLEISDETIEDGLHREKIEEIGAGCALKVLTHYSYNVLYRKESEGTSMILPHYYAEFTGGEIALSDEYDQYEWVHIDSLHSFEPKIANIPHVYERVLRLKQLAQSSDFIEI